jgi:hypothetical protein
VDMGHKERAAGNKTLKPEVEVKLDVKFDKV